MQYVLLFLEGIITFISPCLLPMLPVYISYFAAGDADKRKTVVNSLGFVLGFTLVFVAMGALAGSLGKLLYEYTTVLNVIAGFIVIAFGLNFLGVIRIDFLNRVRGSDMDLKKLGFISSVIFGSVFSVTWTPCVGAFLGSALAIASASGSVIHGTIMLLTFSAGLGLPFVLSAVLIDRLKGTIDFIKRHYRIINIVSGVLLIIVGVLMAVGLMGYFLSLLTF